MNYPVEVSRPRGVVDLIARDAEGNYLERYHADNLIVDGGLAWLAGGLSGDVADPSIMKYLAIGTGATGADEEAHDDTALVTQVETRTTGTQSLVTTNVADDTYQVTGLFTMTAARAVTECGLFSAATDGTLGARKTFEVMNIPSGGTLQITWQWIFTAS